jgi:excisionase family DNA binding protein
MELLTARDVAELLRCSRSEVYALKGKIQYCKIGGMVRFKREDVLKFIDDNMVAPNERRDPPPSPQQLKHLHL